MTSKIPSQSLSRRSSCGAAAVEKRIRMKTGKNRPEPELGYDLSRMLLEERSLTDDVAVRRRLP